MPKTDPRFAAIAALLLLVIAANAGIAARSYLQGVGGQVIFVATRVWILVLPLFWLWRVEKRRVVFTWPSRSEVLAGVLLGLVMGTAIGGGYALLGRAWMDAAVVRTQAAQVGLLNPVVYFAFAVYFTFGNAFIEEYVWRWFAYRKCEVLVPGLQAIALAALLFTLHHIIALAGFTADGRVVLLGSMGVFIAGTVWSGCYLAYRSLWVCYISHLLADLAIALVGWHLLFG